MLDYQIEYTAEVMRARLGDEVLRTLVPEHATLEGNLAWGRALHREMDKALAMNHGILSHSGAAMAEAFLHQGPFRLNGLLSSVEGE